MLYNVQKRSCGDLLGIVSVLLDFVGLYFYRETFINFCSVHNFMSLISLQNKRFRARFVIYRYC